MFLFISYKPSYWWWFLVTTLHLDAGVAAQLLIEDPVVSRSVQLGLTVAMLLASLCCDPYEKHILTRLACGSLVAQFAMCVSALVLLLTDNAVVQVLIDVVLSAILLGMFGCFAYEIRRDISFVAQRVAEGAKAGVRRCGQCCSRDPSEAAATGIEWTKEADDSTAPTAGQQQQQFAYHVNAMARSEARAVARQEEGDEQQAAL